MRPTFAKLIFVMGAVMFTAALASARAGGDVSSAEAVEIVSGQTVPLKLGGTPSLREGGTDSGGGDPTFMWETLLKLPSDSVLPKDVLAHALALFFGNDLDRNTFRSRLSGLLLVLNPETIENQDVRRLFVDLKKRGLIEDVSLSPLRFRNRCTIQENGTSVERAATASMNEPGTDVCIDVVKMAESMGGVARSSVLFGLLVHEYVHHFGLLDRDHRIAVEFAKAFEKMRAGVGTQDLLAEIGKAYRSLWEANEPWIQDWKTCLRERACFQE